MDKEIRLLEENQTWILTDLPVKKRLLKIDGFTK